MSEHIITFNAGSSSIKFALFSVDADGRLRRAAAGQVDGLGSNARLVAKAADGLCDPGSAAARGPQVLASNILGDKR